MSKVTVNDLLKHYKTQSPVSYDYFKHSVKALIGNVDNATIGAAYDKLAEGWEKGSYDSMLGFRHIKQNPAASVPDKDAARELYLYTETTYPYSERLRYVYAALGKKVNKGIYDSTKAPKIFLPLLADAAKGYEKEYGGRGLFSAATRRLAAQDFAEHFEDLRQGDIYAEDEAERNPAKTQLRKICKGCEIRNDLYKAIHGKNFKGDYCDICRGEKASSPKKQNPDPDRLRLPNKYKGVSISWGTLNYEHILDAFIDFADSHRKYVGTKVNLREAKAILKRIKSASVARDNSKLMDAYEDAGEMISAFEDAFNEIAPIGTYFGSLEGDGSDLGFWSWEDE